MLVIDRINDESNGLRVILIESKPRFNERDDTSSVAAEAVSQRIYQHFLYIVVLDVEKIRRIKVS